MKTTAQKWVQLWRLAERDSRHCPSFDALDQGTPFSTTGAEEDRSPECDSCGEVVESPGLCLRCEDEENEREGVTR